MTVMVILSTTAGVMSFDRLEALVALPFLLAAGLFW